MNRNVKDFLRVSVIAVGSHTGEWKRTVRVVEGRSGEGVEVDVLTRQDYIGSDV